MPSSWKTKLFKTIDTFPKRKCSCVGSACSPAQHVSTSFYMAPHIELPMAIEAWRSTVHRSWRETVCRDSSAPVSRALATPSFEGRAEYDTSERRIRESFLRWQRFRRFFSRSNRRRACIFFLTHRFHWMRLPDADGAYRFWATRKRVWSADDQTSYLAEHMHSPEYSLAPWA